MSCNRKLCFNILCAITSAVMLLPIRVTLQKNVTNKHSSQNPDQKLTILSSGNESHNAKAKLSNTTSNDQYSETNSGAGDYEFEYAFEDQIAEADKIVEKFDNIVDSLQLSKKVSTDGLDIRPAILSGVPNDKETVKYNEAGQLNTKRKYSEERSDSRLDRYSEPKPDKYSEPKPDKYLEPKPDKYLEPRPDPKLYPGSPQHKPDSKIELDDSDIVSRSYVKEKHNEYRPSNKVNLPNYHSDKQVHSNSVENRRKPYDLKSQRSAEGYQSHGYSRFTSNQDKTKQVLGVNSYKSLDVRPNTFGSQEHPKSGEKSHQSEHGKWVQQGSGKFDNRLPAPISIYD